MYKVGRSRTPQGVRGLKPLMRLSIVPDMRSHSARSAWIETAQRAFIFWVHTCRTPQGVRGLKLSKKRTNEDALAQRKRLPEWQRKAMYELSDLTIGDAIGT